MSNNPPLAIRETPTGDATWATDPTRQIRSEAERKLVLKVRNIQGNIIGGFNKDHQTMVFLSLSKAANTAAVRGWVQQLEPQVATAEEVLAFNGLFKAMRTRRRREGLLKVTWLNVAFSSSFLRTLDPSWGKTDEAFDQGMASRSVNVLADPKAGDGSEGTWLFGGSKNPVDVVLIVASDSPADLSAYVDELVKGLPDGLTEVTRVEGATLGGDMKGHEHFGFLDDISQPGIRGRASEDPGDVLTRRQNPNNPGQGKPGQDLVWPGEFVFGYPDQGAVSPRADGERAETSDKPPTRNPDEIEAAIDDEMAEAAAEEEGAKGSTPPKTDVRLKDGSFLVVRRLTQHVQKFHDFVKDQSTALQISPELLGAKLVGRWKSGAPIARAPSEDNEQLGDNDCANNDFEFREQGLPLKALGSPYCTRTQFPVAQPDVAGDVCPFAAHVRKTYTRDDIDNEHLDISEEHAQKRRLLRRGIPFTLGPIGKQEKGLLFACYQTSIVNQFEAVQRAANDPDFKTQGTGHDLIIGQTNDNGRARFANIKVNGVTTKVKAPADFVTPTGGGYFFAPSITLLKTLGRGPR